MTPKAVIFDCDGVIVDSEGPTFVLLQQNFATFGLDVTLHDLETNFIGGTMADVEARARLQGAKLPPTWRDDFYEVLYAHLAQGVPLVSGILDVLDRLDAQGIPYAVGSNGSDRKMQVTLGQYPGLTERFQGRLFSGQTLGRPKPAPDLYLHAARSLGAKPSECVVIEDSPTGARAAQAAGITCYGYAAKTDGARLAGEGAIVFHSMADLPGLLGL
jgi:HAD superfamily hydrolase (TIGR01509 family)